MPSTPSPSPSPDPPASAVEASAAGPWRSPGADRSSPMPQGLLVLLTAAGAVAAVAGLRAASGIVGPAFQALVIVVTIHPLLAWLQRHRVPSWLAVVLTMVCAYAALRPLAPGVFAGRSEPAVAYRQAVARRERIVHGRNDSATAAALEKTGARLLCGTGRVVRPGVVEVDGTQVPNTRTLASSPG
jgi:hypothetical protein